jgi:glutamate formiminotransferase
MLKAFGKKWGRTKGTVYLYEEASNQSHRKSLKQIRGEYEGFKDKILKPEWKPDFGRRSLYPNQEQL